MEKRPCSRTPAEPRHPDRVVGRTPPKARNLCRTTPTILCLLLFVLLFFLDLLFLLLYVLLLSLHVFLLLLQVFLCFLYVLLLFLYVLLFLLGFVTPTTTQDQRQCQENYSCKTLKRSTSFTMIIRPPFRPLYLAA
jgi:hypothetical protein